MEYQRLHSISQLYKSTLLDNVLPFWMTHSPDKEFGGYFTCLDRDGSVFDTDKFFGQTMAVGIFH
ncbi:MAG: hypothetical protein LW630_12745 [Saprospiraceae bacterium]|nr:hypothetical protein [Saprospiraceae bacterium]